MPYELNETGWRQAELYRFLLSRRNDWTPMREVVLRSDLYPDIPFRGFHNTHARRMLTADIAAINDSEEYPMIIISGSRGIKLADRAEYERFIKSELTEIFRKLRRIRKMARKAGLDGQAQLWGEIREAFMEGS